MHVISTRHLDQGVAPPVKSGAASFADFATAGSRMLWHLATAALVLVRADTNSLIQLQGLQFHLRVTVLAETCHNSMIAWSFGMYVESIHQKVDTTNLLCWWQPERGPPDEL